mmetsp:Transcript_16886/g.28267  ORF Transcript_16886/g.28267 Transcript_16886/m.28267 type:complete len:207 (+) Transcript_16886:1059-1679(+)
MSLPLPPLPALAKSITTNQRQPFNLLQAPSYTPQHPYPKHSWYLLLTVTRSPSRVSMRVDCTRQVPPTIHATASATATGICLPRLAVLLLLLAMVQVGRLLFLVLTSPYRTAAVVVVVVVVVMVVVMVVSLVLRALQLLVLSGQAFHLHHPLPPMVRHYTPLVAVSLYHRLLHKNNNNNSNTTTLRPLMLQWLLPLVVVLNPGHSS